MEIIHQLGTGYIFFFACFNHCGGLLVLGVIAFLCSIPTARDGLARLFLCSIPTCRMEIIHRLGTGYIFSFACFNHCGGLLVLGAIAFLCSIPTARGGLSRLFLCSIPTCRLGII